MKKSIPGFDLLKFAMSLGIVAIHTQLAMSLVSIDLPLLGGVISHYNSLCVPSFFIISSFFFFKKCWIIRFKNDCTIYMNFRKRLLVIYFFYFVILSPIIIPNRGYLSKGVIEGIGTFFMDLLLRYTYPGSWFLSALMVAATIIYLCGRYIKPYWLLLPLLVFHLYVYHTEMFPKNMQVYYDWYECYVRTMRLSFTAALFPVCLGAVLSHPYLLSLYDKIKAYNKYCLIALLTLFAIYCITDAVILSFVLLVMLFVSFYNMDLSPSPIYYKLREYSILFFFWHFIVLQVFKAIWHDDTFHFFGVSLFFIVVVLIFIIATIIMTLENKKYLGWLKFSH